MKICSLAALLLAALSIARADPLLPLNPGAVWDYHIVDSVGEERPARISIRVAGYEEHAGKQLLKLETRHDGVLSKSELVALEARGLLRYEQRWSDGREVEFDPPQVLVPEPLRVGAKWELNEPDIGLGPARQFRVEAEENVAVPAGTFRAFRMRYEEPWPLSILVERWFTPGVGWIKDSTSTRGPGGRLISRVTMELTKFTPAPPSTPTPAPKPTPALSPTPSPSAAPVPVSTPTATPLAGSPVIKIELSKTADGPPETTFASDTPNIFVFWHGDNLPINSTVRLAWIAEDVGDIVDPNFIVDQVSTFITTASFGGRFTLSRPQDGWAAGKYRIELYLEDQLTASVAVTIQE